MPPLRVIQLASYSGNIGDNANHMGFRPWFERQLGRDVIWTNLEIREFYWKLRLWDGAFVDLVNHHDLLVIGGGNYFELWVEDSPTGCSIAMSPDILARLSTPIFFNALGVDPGQGTPDVSLTRFRAFLDTLLENPRYLVSVRNDGARDNTRRYVGQRYAEAISRIPDGGFFTSSPAPRGTEKEQPLIAINLAGDMPETRFKEYGGTAGRVHFASEIVQTIVGLSGALTKSRFILVPHIARDLSLIAEVIDQLDDDLSRTRLAVAPYGVGDTAARAALSLYAASDLVLAMRFHANVCPIGMGRQTLGLVCYPQIANLYAELDQTDRLIDVSRQGFAVSLIDAALTTIDAPANYRGSPADALASVSQLRRDFEPVLASWLIANQLLAD